jgi:hypothetical protein
MFLLQGLFAADGLVPGDFTPCGPDFRRIFNPTGHKLKPETEKFPLQGIDLLLHLFGRKLAKVPQMRASAFHAF